jgi:hypothetical protein
MGCEGGWLGQGGWAGLAWAAIPCSSPLQCSTRAISLVLLFSFSAKLQTDVVKTFRNSSAGCSCHNS